MKKMTDLLKSLYTKPINSLPKDIQAAIKENPYLCNWDNQTPERRERLCQIWDRDHDPKFQTEIQQLDDLFESKALIERQLAAWENLESRTVKDEELKELIISKYQSDLKQVNNEISHGNDIKYSSYEEEYLIRKEHLHGSKENSYMKMILGMAMEKYEYHPNKGKNHATGVNRGSIKDDLSKHGLNLDEKTISKILKHAADAFLPNKLNNKTL